MFHNLNLSTKIVIILAPLVILAVSISVYLNYHYQEQLILSQAKDAAEGQASIIKSAIVHQMFTNERVDDSFLKQISTEGLVDNLQVVFALDNLHLKTEYLTPDRLDRLRARELRVEKGRFEDAEEVMRTGQPFEVLNCSTGEHPDRPLNVVSDWKPFILSDCEQLRLVLPFAAETKCQNCHEVPLGHVLGTAFMDIPLTSTTRAIRTNAEQSIFVFVLFIVLAGFVLALIFNKYVARPVRRLVKAAEMVGTGDLQYELGNSFDNDEFGKLADSFKEMQKSLDTAQKELITRERLSTVGQMASSIIHDFRNPMTVVALSIDVLKRDRTIAEERRGELYRNVSVALEQMKKMTQELLDFSRGELRLELRECEIQTFADGIRNAVGSHLQTVGMVFTSESNCFGTMKVDAERLSRAIINIINNAEDALPKGGSIRFLVTSDAKSVVFNVTDNGAGIPESIRDNIFEPFVTKGKRKGTGLGLAIAKKVVDEHHGSISFETEVYNGTTFTISVPRNV